MNAIEDTEFRRGWEELGEALPKPRAVVCVSAHWETRGVSVTASERPSTIHDFFGFPSELFEIQYPAPGDPALASEIVERLSGYQVRADLERGLDHGSWSVLRAIYPDADVPVLQLSLYTGKPAEFHYALGKELAFLREQGVLLLGSGDIVHNLRKFRFDDPEPPDWALDFDEQARSLVEEGNDDALIDYGSLGPYSALAVPTPEHYLPLLYVLAIRSPGEPVRFFNEKVISSVSMTSFIVG